MAELAGLVVGGIGLSGLAIQLLESAQKAERLYANFQGKTLGTQWKYVSRTILTSLTSRQVRLDD